MTSRSSCSAAGEAEATLLAAAGLDRLGRDVGVAIPVETMLPAPAQGAVGIETLTASAELCGLLAAIDDAATRARVEAERALLAALGADCRSPVAALATLEDGALRLRAEILSFDGRHCAAGETMVAGPDDAAALARALLAGADPELRTLFAG